MGCSPGSPCNPSPLPMVYAAYPSNCKDIPNGCCPTSKTLYDGPNLPNTGIENKDNVSVALDKIDDALDPTTIVQNFINIISANPSLAVIFCDLVSTCSTPDTTTTTSTSSSSTSTSSSTTTAFSPNFPCNSPLAVSGVRGVNTMTTNLGSGIGAIIINFEPLNLPDGIVVTYNGVSYNGLSSPINGWLQGGLANNPTYLGRLSSDCDLVLNSPYTLSVYNYVSGSFVDTGGTEVVSIISSQLNLTPLAPGSCVMVIPKLTAAPSTLSIKVISPCTTAAFFVQALCPAALISFNSSVVSGSYAGACANAINRTYYVAHVNGFFGDVLLYDLIFSDPNGEFKLGAGYYKTTSSSSGNVLQVDSNGVVIDIVSC